MNTFTAGTVTSFLSATVTLTTESVARPRFETLTRTSEAEPIGMSPKSIFTGSTDICGRTALRPESQVQPPSTAMSARQAEAIARGEASIRAQDLMHHPRKRPAL
jgi:hypothetical protein